jgi:hypothetical protein
MDTKALIADTKARFSHNSARAYLKDKYDSKLTAADQGGLWKATPELLGFLASQTDDQVILMDTFDNPVLVDRVQLFNVLDKAYRDTMNLWYAEWKELESKR